jgi:hypothetical protein
VTPAGEKFYEIFRKLSRGALSRSSNMLTPMALDLELPTTCAKRPLPLNLSRFKSFAKYCPRTKPTLEDRGGPTLRFGKSLNFYLPFCVRHLVARPATLHIIFKNDAKSSFFKPCCNMFGKCLHILINQANSAFSLLRIREIL